MSSIGERVADAARALIGAPFRPQGREPAFGLDCVGLAAMAFRSAGIHAEPPRDYPLRGGDARDITAMIERIGLARIETGDAAAGDLLLLRAGPAQFHLAIRTANGFVHADAGLRRVVETPGSPPWPVLGAWRASGVQG